MRKLPNPPIQEFTEVDPAVSGVIEFLDPLSGTDRVAIEALAERTKTPYEILPDDMPKNEIMATLDLFCGALKSIELTGRKINPIIGRLMIIIRDSPEIYKSRGHSSFRKFISDHLTQIGYHRSSVYFAMQMVEKHPTLTIGDWEAIGLDRLLTISKFCKHEDPSYWKYIEKAKELMGISFQQWIATQGLIESGDTSRVPVVFNATKTVEKGLREFMEDPRIHEIVGSSDPGRIAEAMVQECSNEWLQGDGRVVPTGVRWTCSWCGESGDIDLRKEKTLDGVVRVVTDAHRLQSEDCEMADSPGELTISINRD